MVCIGKKRTRGTKSGFISGRTKTYKKRLLLCQKEILLIFTVIYNFIGKWQLEN